jgi:uncharacterized protein
MISRDLLKLVLTEQKIIIENKSFGIKREILDIVKTKKKLPHVVILTGIRRSGKSTLLKQIIETYYKKDYYYINFEDERLFNFQAQDFNQVYDVLLEIYGEKKTFFIDEIQNVDKFELFIRRFYEKGFKFFITGSNANLLSKEFGTKLTGRHVNITVKPFSFKEYLIAKNTKIDLYNSENISLIKQKFNEYLIKGGMPEFVIFNDPEILIRIYEDIIIKDVSVRYNVDNFQILKELYQYIITNFSKKFSYNSLKKFININSSNTIKKYIDYLSQTHLISLINKYDTSLKKQLINDKKAYILDNGFIHFVSKKSTKDKGWLLENLIYNYISNKKDVFYLSNGFECDFIQLIDKHIFQVTYELNDENKKREINGLINAMKYLKTNSGYILTYDQEDTLSINNNKINIIPVWKFLLKNDIIVN